MQPKDIIRQVKNIELRTKHLVDGLLAGNYHSVFKGNGIEFSEIRDYRWGDDVRSIDWNVTARYDHPYVKEFIEERDLHVYFVIDLSASLDFGKTTEKKRKALEMVGALMFAGMRNNDNIGLCMGTQSVEKYVPARKGRKHVLTMLSLLVLWQPTHKVTDMNTLLQFVSRTIKKRSVIFLISDFDQHLQSNYLNLLKKRHDVIALRVEDTREHELPDVGLINLEDEETGEQIEVDTHDPKIREKFRTLVNNHRERVSNQFQRHRIDVLDINTDHPYELPLRMFFKKRKSKVVS